jgi:hypothetical protein
VNWIRLPLARGSAVIVSRAYVRARVTPCGGAAGSRHKTMTDAEAPACRTADGAQSGAQRAVRHAGPHSGNYVTADVLDGGPRSAGDVSTLPLGPLERLQPGPALSVERTHCAISRLRPSVSLLLSTRSSTALHGTARARRVGYRHASWWRNRLQHTLRTGARSRARESVRKKPRLPPDPFALLGPQVAFRAMQVLLRRLRRQANRATG